MMSMKHSNKPAPAPTPFWLSNAIFFVSTHLLALYGICSIRPLVTFVWIQIDGSSHPAESKEGQSSSWELQWQWRGICFVFIMGQLSLFGITMGYHRLFSHRSFVCTSPSLKLILLLFGTLGTQGSAKWWVLRHRLHHRFTDTSSDPYNAKQGLWWSHCGWIFWKTRYEKLEMVERGDLDRDPLVGWQHKHYLTLTLGLCFVLPSLISYLFWSDALLGLIYGGFLGRILIWHFTFLINSVAHYLGEKNYDLEVTARGNFLLAFFTGGEGNHNFHHCFPTDFRNGGERWDWDPTKWLILAIHSIFPSAIPKLNVTPTSEVDRAKEYVKSMVALGIDPYHHPSSEDTDFEDFSSSPSSSSPPWLSSASPSSDEDAFSSLEPSSLSIGTRSVQQRKVQQRETSPVFNLIDDARGGANGQRANHPSSGSSLPVWRRNEVKIKLRELEKTGNGKQMVVILLEGYLVDVTRYLSYHPGGPALLLSRRIDYHSTDNGCSGTEGSTGMDFMKDSTEDFLTLNHHQWAAREKVRDLRIGRVIDDYND